MKIYFWKKQGKINGDVYFIIQTALVLNIDWKTTWEFKLGRNLKKNPSKH